jgi:multicomponent Na+:H+ antiporter subunit E
MDMALQILLNLVIAFIWMFLNSSWDGVTFFKGYLIGLVLIFVLERLLPQQFYLKKVWAIFKLLVLFLKELLFSSITVLRLIIRPKLDIRPGIFSLPTELKSDWEITLLSCLITLTPGTLTLDISPDGKTLYIHAMDIPNDEEVVMQIKDTFEKAIMEVTKNV